LYIFSSSSSSLPFWNKRENKTAGGIQRRHRRRLEGLWSTYFF
jgi:hypothetical protein